MSYSIRTVTVSAFRIFIALKPNPCLLTSSLNSCFKIHTAQLHNSSPSGGLATRFRNHRRANGSQQRTTGKALLDKFVKHLSLDGGNIVEIFIARKSALEKTQLSDVLITDNLF